jgi:hypothetical protein
LGKLLEHGQGNGRREHPIKSEIREALLVGTYRIAKQPAGTRHMREALPESKS